MQKWKQKNKQLHRSLLLKHNQRFKSVTRSYLHQLVPAVILILCCLSSSGIFCVLGRLVLVVLAERSVYEAR